MHVCAQAPPLSRSLKPSRRTPKGPVRDPVPILTSQAVCPVLLPPWFSEECLHSPAFQTPPLIDTFLTWTGASGHSSSCPPDPHPTGDTSPLSSSQCRAGVHKGQSLPWCLGLVVTPQPRSGWTRLAPSLRGGPRLVLLQGGEPPSLGRPSLSGLP